MNKIIKKILELSDYNIKNNTFAIRQNAGKKYLIETIEEIKEALIEYKENNKIYLEDELGDIFWDWLQAVKIAERDGLIKNADNVFQHLLEKYTERLEILDTNEYQKEKIKYDNDHISQEWINVKNKQKAELKRKHIKLYND